MGTGVYTSTVHQYNSIQFCGYIDCSFNILYKHHSSSFFMSNIHTFLFLYRQDSIVQTLVDMSFSVNSFPSISVWEHTFVPREYLVSHLEDLFMKYVVNGCIYNCYFSYLSLSHSEIVIERSNILDYHQLRNVNLHGVRFV